ncbi:MAG: hypothetical protein RL489_891 [Pseudomonadota bacterium]|jgi:type IV pilus assembly protein PilE
MLSAQPRPAAPARGLTLIEMVVVLTLLALLAAIALPSWQQQLQRGRRGDAIAALARIELAQQDWRSRHAQFAQTLAADGLALPALSPAGHYRLSIATEGPDPASGYRAVAQAIGAQQGDSACLWMAIELSQGELRPRSGPDPRLGNAAAENRDCWRP